MIWSLKPWLITRTVHFKMLSDEVWYARRWTRHGAETLVRKDQKKHPKATYKIEQT